jgi:hypothetical protein
MRAYVNEGLLSEIEIDRGEEDDGGIRLRVPDVLQTTRKSSTSMESDTSDLGERRSMNENVDKALDDFDDLCKQAMDELRRLKNVIKKTREHIRQKKRQFEEKSVIKSVNQQNNENRSCRPDDNLYYNYCVLKTALDPMTLSLRCLCNQARNIVEPLHTFQNTPWLSLTFSKKQPMSKERALPLVQKTADLLSRDDCSSDITEAAFGLNQSLNPILCSNLFVNHHHHQQTEPTAQHRNVYTLVIWGRSGMAWHTHGFPNTRLKCEFHGWTIFACKSSVNQHRSIEDARTFFELLDRIIGEAETTVGKETLTGPLPSFVCKALENAIGGSWNCAVGRTGCQHAVAISDPCVAEGLVKLEQGGLEFLIWQN